MHSSLLSRSVRLRTVINFDLEKGIAWAECLAYQVCARQVRSAAALLQLDIDDFDCCFDGFTPVFGSP